MGREKDFDNCTIYHIRAIDTKRVLYVGSTTDFKTRCSRHKWGGKNGTTPIYTYIREQGGFELFEIVPVSFLQLTDALELRMEEQLEMEKYTSLLNAQNAYTSNEDLLKRLKASDEKNKVKLQERRRARHERNLKKEKEQSKARYELNKEKIKEQMKVYRELNTEKLKEKKKVYRELNKEKLKEEGKVYNELNKEILKEKRKAKREQKKSAITA